MSGFDDHQVLVNASLEITAADYRIMRERVQAEHRALQSIRDAEQIIHDTRKTP